MQSRGVYWAAGACAVATGVVLLWPRVPFVVPGPALHAAVETAAGAIAVLAATLAGSRFRIERQARDLALAAAFALFALGNLGFSVVPAVVGDERLTVFDTWAALTTRGVAAAAFCTAAFLPARRIDARVGPAVALATAGVGLLIGITYTLIGPALPLGVGIDTAVGEVPTQLFPHPLLAATQVAQLLLYSAAVVGLHRRATREADRAAAWLAVAAVLSAFARLHYVLHPSLYADVVYSGDVFRLGFYVTVLGAMGLELRARYRQAAELSVLEERRRLARDFHDGLAQELAFVVARTRSLTTQFGSSPQLSELASAAERALDESRRAIASLVQAADRPLPTMLAQATEEVASRFGVPLRLALPEEEVPVTPEQREMLIRVAREAVANAARHAGATEVAVTLSHSEGVRLTISDDGAGFDPEAAPEGHGFGLASMRERAEAVSGRFALRSGQGQGTTVEVEL